ncbi:MAG: carotenoid biosynthesis protein [Promethearchaeota archaeon]
MVFFTLFAELSAFLLFLGVLFYLWFMRKDHKSIAQIVSGSLFGVTLEFMNVQVMHTYTYSPEFLIQLGSPPDNIPICIGLCWGLIIYACMNVSNKVVNIPEWSRSVLDGFLALTIDLSMDTIAIRLDGGFWSWIDIPMEPFPTLNSFFGVNYGNFVGWFFVVLIFSVMLRLEEKEISKKFNVPSILSILYFLIIPFFSYLPLFLSFHVLPLPVYILFNILSIYNYSIPSGLTGLSILIYTMILASIILLVPFSQSKPIVEKNTDLLPPIIFIFFHLSYFGFYFLGGLFSKTPLILLLGILMFIIDGFINFMTLDMEKLSIIIKDFMNIQ